MLYPIISKVPETIKKVKGKQRVKALSDFSRQILFLSASKTGVVLKELKKGKAGNPLPSNGIFWSISHKPDSVAAVVSNQPIGIDIEEVKDISTKVIHRILKKEELGLFEKKDINRVFFKCFTAKEAVLKCAGTGLKDIFKVRVIKVLDFDNLQLRYLEDDYIVENFSYNGYVASIIKNEYKIIWDVNNINF